MGVLQNKIVLITGAAGGFGQAISKEFSRQGAHLALLDINHAALEDLASSLRADNAIVHAVAADLSTEQGVKNGIDKVLAHFDCQVDTLIANVGVLIADRCENLRTEQWEQAFAINFFSHVWAADSIIPLMKMRKAGCIVFVGSDQGLQPDAGLAPYSVAKAALHNYAKVLARELPPYQICVHAVAPGMSRTPLVMELMDKLAEEFGTDQATAEVQELQRRGVPVARLGEPEEVAHAVAFLASEPFSNGTILNFSGGNVRAVIS